MRGKGYISLIRKQLLTTLLLSLIGCGLSTSIYLYFPQDFTITQTNMSVKNDPRNYEASEPVLNQTFKGIDIYYRVFQNQATAQNVHDQQLENLKNVYDGNPNAFIQSVEDSLEFRLMRNATNSSRPLISMLANDESEYIISIKDWKINSGDSVLRDITRPEKSFLLKDFKKADEDYTGEDLTGIEDVYLVAFAISYGKDTVGASVYSDPFIALNILAF